MAFNSVYTGYSTAKSITPSDTVPNNFKAIYVGGAGNVTLKDVGGNSALFTAPPVGSIIPVETTFVMATGTTATLLIGLN